MATIEDRGYSRKARPKEEMGKLHQTALTVAGATPVGTASRGITKMLGLNDEFEDFITGGKDYSKGAFSTINKDIYGALGDVTAAAIPMAASMAGIPGLDGLAGIGEGILNKEEEPQVQMSAMGGKRKKRFQGGGFRGNLVNAPGNKSTEYFRDFKDVGLPHGLGGMTLGKNTADGTITEIEEDEFALINPEDSEDQFYLSARVKDKATNKSYAQLARDKVKKKPSFRKDDSMYREYEKDELNKIANAQEATKKELGIEDTSGIAAYGGKRKYPDGGGRLDVEGALSRDYDIMGQSTNKDGLYGNVSLNEFGNSQKRNTWFNWDGFDVKNRDHVTRFQTEFNTKLGADKLKVDGLWGQQTASAYIDPLNTPIENNSNNTAAFNQVFKMPEEAGIVDELTSQTSSSASIPDSQEAFARSFAPAALGYAAQSFATSRAARQLKPNLVQPSMMNAEQVDYTEQRNQAIRDSRTQMALARKGASGADSAGMAMNFLAGAGSDVYGRAGEAIGSSFMNQDNTNAGLRMEAGKFNAAARMEADARNVGEKTRVQEGRADATMRQGDIAATAGKDYLNMTEQDTMMNILMGSNPDYTYEVKGGKLERVMRVKDDKAYGGKRFKSKGKRRKQ